MFRASPKVWLHSKVAGTTATARQMRKQLIVIAAFAAPAIVLGASNTASAYTIYGAEQPWHGGPPWPSIPFPGGEAAQTAFISALSSPIIVDTLDGLSHGSPAGQSLFGGLAKITQSSIAVPALYAEWCYFGSQCLERNPYTANPLLVLSFSQPVDSFGFWANHQNSYDNQITVRINGGPVVLGPSATSGASSFFGFIASEPSEWITSLEFITSNEKQGYLYFDQFSTTRAVVPGPVPAMATVMAFGWSRSLRRRIKSSQRVSDI
jgi:hypothetical protein